MAVETEIQDNALRRRKLGNTSNESSSADLLNNNHISCNNENECEEEQEHDFDADNSTLETAVADDLKHKTENLSHDETLNKLKEVGAKTPILPSEIGTDFNFKRQVVWPNAIGFIVLHLCALVGVLLVMFGFVRFYTVLYSKYSLNPSSYQIYI